MSQNPDPYYFAVVVAVAGVAVLAADVVPVADEVEIEDVDVDDVAAAEDELVNRLVADRD